MPVHNAQRRHRRLQSYLARLLAIALLTTPPFDFTTAAADPQTAHNTIQDC